MWKKIENGTLGIPAPEPIGKGGPDLHWHNAMDGEALQQKKLTNEEKIANTRVSRARRVVDKTWNISEQIQGSNGHHGAKAKGCVVLHNMVMTQQGLANRAPNPTNDVVALQNKQ